MTRIARMYFTLKAQKAQFFLRNTNILRKENICEICEICGKNEKGSTITKRHADHADCADLFSEHGIISR